MPRSRRYGTSARASAKPKSDDSWRRYVARSSIPRSEFISRGPLQDHDRPRDHLDLGAGAIALTARLGRRVGGRELELPLRAKAPAREREHAILGLGVDQQHERVVLHFLPLRAGSRDLAAVQEHPEHVLAALPVAPGHLVPVGAKPPHIREPRAHELLAAQEAVAPEHLVLAAQSDQPTGELAELALFRVLGPVVP